MRRATALNLAALAGSQLSVPERTRLTELEGVVRRGLDGFLEVAGALLEIRDKRLYRERHGTFQEYCERVWDLTARRARQIIDAADVVNELQKAEGRLQNGATAALPTSERQVRALVPLDAQERKAAWDLAVDEAGGKVPTGKQVAAAVAQIQTPNTKHQTPKGAQEFVVCRMVDGKRTYRTVGNGWTNDPRKALLYGNRRSAFVVAERHDDDVVWLGQALIWFEESKPAPVVPVPKPKPETVNGKERPLPAETPNFKHQTPSERMKRVALEAALDDLQVGAGWILEAQKRIEPFYFPNKIEWIGLFCGALAQLEKLKRCLESAR